MTEVFVGNDKWFTYNGPKPKNMVELRRLVLQAGKNCNFKCMFRWSSFLMGYDEDGNIAFVPLGRDGKYATKQEYEPCEACGAQTSIFVSHCCECHICLDTTYPDRAGKFMVYCHHCDKIYYNDPKLMGRNIYQCPKQIKT